MEFSVTIKIILLRVYTFGTIGNSIVYDYGDFGSLFFVHLVLVSLTIRIIGNITESLIFVFSLLLLP